MSVQLILLVFLSLVVNSIPQLVIYVKNQGDEIFHQRISANVSDDSVLLEFIRPDGVYIIQVIDFANELQLVKAVIPGEMELGQNNLQILCFLSHSDKTEFIAPDAMVKLRQKNPGTIRLAEEDKGTSYVALTGWISLIMASKLSPILKKYCSEPEALILASERNVLKWAASKDFDPKEFESQMTSFPKAQTDNLEDIPYARCPHVFSFNESCLCHFSVCIIWYPCGLKYCKGKSQLNSGMQNLSYRCGIKTCKKCQTFEYYVRKKAQCVWDQ